MSRGTDGKKKREKKGGRKKNEINLLGFNVLSDNYSLRFS